MHTAYIFTNQTCDAPDKCVLIQSESAFYYVNIMNICICQVSNL